MHAFFPTALKTASKTVMYKTVAIKLLYNRKTLPTLRGTVLRVMVLRGAVFYVGRYGFAIKHQFLRVQFKGAVCEASQRPKNNRSKNRTPKTALI